MSTEANMYYTDKIQPTWWQSVQAANLQGYAWCKIGGVIVAGSEDVAVAQAPPQTGDTVADLAAWIEDVIQAMTGDAPQGFGYPSALPVTGWGVAIVPLPGNNLNGRPSVILGATSDYDFGDLNLPPHTNPDNSRIWYFRVEAISATALEIVPSLTPITAYAAAHGGILPTLQVLELNPE